MTHILTVVWLLSSVNWRLFLIFPYVNDTYIDTYYPSLTYKTIFLLSVNDGYFSFAICHAIRQNFLANVKYYVLTVFWVYLWDHPAPQNHPKFVVEKQSNMKTQTATSQPTSEHQNEVISIYREHSKEVLKILRDFAIGYRLIGEDQSRRMVYQITYDDNQLSNIVTIRKGIRELERSTHFTDLIITGIRRLLS